MKCCNCKKTLVKPFKTFNHEYNACNKYQSKRKPVCWCQECWEKWETKNNENCIKAEQEHKQLIEQLLKANL